MGFRCRVNSLAAAAAPVPPAAVTPLATGPPPGGLFKAWRLAAHCRPALAPVPQQWEEAAVEAEAVEAVVVAVDRVRADRASS